MAHIARLSCCMQRILHTSTSQLSRHGARRASRSLCTAAARPRRPEGGAFSGVLHCTPVTPTSCMGRALYMGRASFSSTAANLPFVGKEHKRSLEEEDLIADEEYDRIRGDVLKFRMAHRKERRVEVGPSASATFASFPLLWTQVQEMLWIEKGGKEQEEEELEAYAPLVPTGNNVVFTFMFEVDDKAKRDALLYRLGYVEDTVALEYEADGKRERILSVTANEEIDRTAPDGKTSAVHFLMIDLKDDNVKSSEKLWLTVGHKDYPHSTLLSDALRASLQSDLD